MKTPLFSLTFSALLLFLIVGADESAEVKAKHPVVGTGSLFFPDCQLGDPCSIQEAEAETEEALELDRNLVEMRDDIDAIRGRLAAQMRYQLPVRQIRNQLKMANRFGKRDKLRMSNRFG